KSNKLIFTRRRRHTIFTRDWISDVCSSDLKKINTMEFNPSNPVVKRCVEGMDMAAHGNAEEANRLFLQAWHGATDDLEKFLAAYYVARHQENVSERLRWYETALRFALAINDSSVYR